MSGSWVKRLGVALIVAIVGGACDPTFAVILDNRSSDRLVVARQIARGDEPQRLDVVVVPPSTRVTMGAFGVASLEQLRRIVVMTEACEVLADELLSEAFVEGGEIIVSDRLVVSFDPGGNPSRGEQAIPTSECSSQVVLEPE